ncbi:HAMP domain-containing sensor histidine kinase [Paraclostridium sordellii]|uniref:sensor histidine kinase n=1 Tax=Paraclostridium sordellii TaxID=1505 RepID=UPI0005DD0CA9|nr:HAMP domain-containing sensor histidine kinase [Paeniclostridium sordellii]CEP80237.1 sensor histidine kinase [[Clostridium] sordellii] [Paeniclostridium sordellii]
MNKSITNKIMMFFLVIIFFVIFSIVMYSNSSLNKIVEYLIGNEIKETTKSINLYLEQYFRFNKMEFNKIAFTAESSYISKDLTYRLGKTVYIYNNRGRLVYPKVDAHKIPKGTKDMENARNGELSYTIEYKDNKALVYVSYPILRDDKFIGMIRFVSDYTPLFEQTTSFVDKTLIFSIMIFAISMIIAYIISKQITLPIKKLANKTKEVTRGNFDVKIDIESEDELGILASDFSNMLETINTQIKTIETDRDNLRELSEKQKKFFDNVTHELKTPMTTIIGYSEIIKDNEFSDIEFFNKGINRIISEANRLNRMIVQLLEISKNTNKNFDYELKKIDLSKIIISMCEDMIHKARKYNMDIKFDVESDIKIIANEDKIKEIIINLLDNSIKYGQVNSDIYLDAHRDGKYVNISVLDTGEGIEASEIDNILSPFYRVSKSETRELGSTGLGLAIVKSIVDSYNGKIYIKSEVNKGTQVIVKLPTIS